MPGQSYGGRYESCSVDVSRSGIAAAPSITSAPQARRRHAVAAAERVVEAAQAREAAGERHFGHRPGRLGQQLLGEQQPACQQELYRRDSKLLLDDAANLPRAELELVGNRLEPRLVIELPFLQALHDELRDPLRIVNRCVPRREFRATTQARAKAGLLGLLRRVEEAAVRRLRRFHAADRTAVDAGRRDADEEHPIESRIASDERVVEPAMILVHGVYDTAQRPVRASHIRTCQSLTCTRPKTASAAAVRALCSCRRRQRTEPTVRCEPAVDLQGGCNGQE